MRMILDLFLMLPAAAPAPQEAPAPEAAPAAEEGAAPRSLLAIAEIEAERSRRLLKERINGSLRSYALARDTAADRGRSHLEAIVQSGADAVPLLLDLLRGVGSGATDASFAGPSARALSGIFDRTRSVAILKGLADIVRSGSGTVRAGVLEGLESLDHPMVIEIVGPLLSEQDPALRTQVVRVLGRQKSSAEFVGKLLRPLLAQEGAPFAETLRALLELGDRGGLEAAQGWVARTSDPLLLGESIRYLAELGGKAQLPALSDLLTRSTQNPPDSALKRAVDAVQRIGLREVDARKDAEYILLQVFKRHSSFGVRDWARWQLGPFQNSEALKSLEDQIGATIRANDRSGRGGNNADAYLSLAEYRVQFEQWDKAVEALKKAQSEDEKGLRAQSIEPLRAVALCGMDKYAAAEKILRTLTADECADLLKRHPVLERMLKDAKYRDLFPPPR